MRERLYLHNAIVRDGQQTPGVRLPTAEQAQIAAAVDRLGVNGPGGGRQLVNSAEPRAFAGVWSGPSLVNKPLIRNCNPLKNNNSNGAPSRDTSSKAQP